MTLSSIMRGPRPAFWTRVVIVLAILVGASNARADEHARALLGLFLNDRWDATINLARADGVVNLWMWNGDQNTNAWIDQYLVPRVAQKYGIRVRRTGVSSPRVFMDRLAREYA